MLLTATPSLKAEEENGDPGELARESIELMMRSLNLLMDSIPQYELPEINEDGDIIIRRKRNTVEPEDEPEEKPDTELEKTRT
ncbi:hypothetical protein [Denitrobaculum tricleocarpae]|uniref:Uncharacterized protein n=1 Tax=Denitrobaculum tricleocarpae TaxID=2591009 RepID=A0A545TXH8_9PROT|nr:hypothetical protein [Denitrobaculum tricleocarpae]TQV81917.1 hypothetical protein FKG95_06690 [Denitrobaculum tricleocarpae]